MEKKLELCFHLAKTRDLLPEDGRLRDAALLAAGRAYAPYSGLKVGAAALLQDGGIVEGNNQENGAYPSGMCAERVALFCAGASFPHMPVCALAIVAVWEGEVRRWIAPCGACRQVMLETELRGGGRPLRVLMCGSEETLIAGSAKVLLPFGFSLAAW
jgi:cytidine deaminase